jgi:AcrR family transcriptional regulator
MQLIIGRTAAMAPRKYDLGKRAEAVEETRRRIIQATFELHGEKGVVATSMQDVAERADVALRTVYYHYPTVDDSWRDAGRR